MSRMLNANNRPARPWRVIAAEAFRESDPSACLRLIEGLNRAIAQQGLESGASTTKTAGSKALLSIARSALTSIPRSVFSSAMTASVITPM